MRQAGRYLPEYRELRQNHSLLELFQSSDAIVHITQMPLRRFSLDAAILYTDILILLDALAISWDVHPGEGPIIARPIRHPDEIARLFPRPAREALDFVLAAIPPLKQQLEVPLIGFVGAPFTIASYLIEGRPTKDFKRIHEWIYRDPESLHTLLALLADVAIDFLNAQIDCGIDAIQIFDTWANLLTPNLFNLFSLPYLKRIMLGIKDPSIPIILFAKGSSHLARPLASLKPAAISLDAQCDIASTRHAFPSLTLQGNLDPYALFAPQERLDHEIDYLLHVMEGDPAFIFNLGHGLLPDTPVDAVARLVDRVHKFSAAMV